jgi:hypothetical protein
VIGAEADARLASLSDPLADPSRNILGVMYLCARQLDRMRPDPGYAVLLKKLSI